MGFLRLDYIVTVIQPIPGSIIRLLTYGINVQAFQDQEACGKE